MSARARAHTHTHTHTHTRIILRTPIQHCLYSCLSYSTHRLCQIFSRRAAQNTASHQRPACWLLLHFKTLRPCKHNTRNISWPKVSIPMISDIHTAVIVHPDSCIVRVPEDAGSSMFWKVITFLPDCTVSNSRRHHSSKSNTFVVTWMWSQYVFRHMFIQTLEIFPSILETPCI
jgi:hypothetical protein